MTLPALPAKAAYITINNAAKRNALSLAVLRDLKSQLTTALTGSSGRLLILPTFDPGLLEKLEANDEEFDWLLSAKRWREERATLPNVLVLRSEGPVFSSGHDLKELAKLPHEEVKETFALCAEVMHLIRHSPAPVVAPIQGFATAAGFQLAMTADYPIALADTPVRLPGATIGLPCTSPSTAVSRRLGNGLTYRLLATAEQITAAEANASGFIDIVPVPEHAESTDTAGRAFRERVEWVIETLAKGPGQPTALGKWAYWTQVGINSPGDGYEEAARWTGRVMALHARADDAREGIKAFFEKRKPEWQT